MKLKFGLDRILDNGGNMILTEGLVLQDEKIWREFVKKDVIPGSNSCELYFEEECIEEFADKLDRLYPVSIGSRLTAGDRKWCVFMIWMGL